MNDYLSDTSFDIESIPDENISPYLMRSPQFVMNESPTQGLTDRDDDAETRTKDETEEIVRGFILEKDIINEEHEKQKKEIIESLLKDREELIEKFKQQIKDIERKIDRNDRGKALPVDAAMPKREVPLYIRLDKRNVISAEDFLSRIQLEDKFESEKDTLERSFRDEKRLLKDRLELEWDRKLQLESRRFESTVEDLTGKIRVLQIENRRLEKELEKRESELKSRTDDFKSRLINERNKIFLNYDEEKSRLKDKLERKHEKEMVSQRDKYERMLNDLKRDLIDATKSISSKEREISSALNSVKDYEERVRIELSAKLKCEYDELVGQLRRENERLNDQTDKLKRENGEFAGRVRDLSTENRNKMSIVDEFTTRLNREYEERLKKTVLENETLKAGIDDLSKKNRAQEEALRNLCENVELLEAELTLKVESLAGCEETKESLRREIQDFSHEIDTLRREKADLQKSVDDYVNFEKAISEKMSKRELQANDAFDKCRISERERMNLEREIALLSENLERCLQERDNMKKDIEKCQKETFTLKKQLKEERNEHERLRERFRRDAEEIRMKESECRSLRAQLREETSKIDNELTKDAEKVDRLMILETENFELQKRLKDYEIEKVEILRVDREEIQRQFAKEFAKRIHEAKRGYEEATNGLRNQIRLLRLKVAQLEELLASKGSDKYTEGECKENSEIMVDGSDMYEKEAFSTARPRQQYSNVKEGLNNQPSRVRLFDYARDHKPNKTTSSIYRSTPVKCSDPASPAYKAQDVESRDIICQGSFARQRSRSLDSTGNRFPAKSCSRIDAAVSKQGADSCDTNTIERRRDGYLFGEETMNQERNRNELMPVENNLQLPQTHKKHFLKRNNSLDVAPSSQEQNQSATKFDGNCGGVAGLPPKYRPNRRSLRENQEANAERWQDQLKNPDAERFEKSVERLQEKLEVGHDELELLWRLKQIQNSVRR